MKCRILESPDGTKLGEWLWLGFSEAEAREWIRQRVQLKVAVEMHNMGLSPILDGDGERIVHTRYVGIPSRTLRFPTPTYHPTKPGQPEGE